jgi:hypothetical protein
MNQGAQILVAMGVFLAGIAAISMAYHHRHILEMALTALTTYRAVMGMVKHE